ncbi:mycofactocin-coupled SDR family oxidoreductase [Streptomyces cellulosae]|uniref:mycofactocin-coupled SDR family oxidoreductase n=1 Tax=Streptomyces cellulosae TaxID=1968 RepID=UPI0004C970F1|nr:mycofactocin-coupled SDR family oxidoreductase [Streptomyces cellulosae]
MNRLENQVAFVTGVARGQGRRIAVRLAEEGADIIGVDLGSGGGFDIDTPHYALSTDADLARTAELIEETGRKAVLRHADVRDFDSLASAVQEGVETFGRLDVVVANAGILSVSPVLDLEERAWQQNLDVNLTGAWHTVKAAVPHLRAGGRGGSIVFITSAAAMLSVPGIGHYATAKAGVNALAKSLAAELGPEWIRVNAVSPGNVDTPMIDNEFTRRLFLSHLEHPGKSDAQEPDSPYVRLHALPVPWVEAKDISNAVVFLASDDARFVTGTVLPVDAGYLVKK